MMRDREKGLVLSLLLLLLPMYSLREVIRPHLEGMLPPFLSRRRTTTSTISVEGRKHRRKRRRMANSTDLSGVGDRLSAAQVQMTMSPFELTFVGLGGEELLMDEDFRIANSYVDDVLERFLLGGDGGDTERSIGSVHFETSVVEQDMDATIPHITATFRKSATFLLIDSEDVDDGAMVIPEVTVLDGALSYALSNPIHTEALRNELISDGGPTWASLSEIKFASPTVATTVLSSNGGTGMSTLEFMSPNVLEILYWTALSLVILLFLVVIILAAKLRKMKRTLAGIKEGKSLLLEVKTTGGSSTSFPEDIQEDKTHGTEKDQQGNTRTSSNDVFDDGDGPKDPQPARPESPAEDEENPDAKEDANELTPAVLSLLERRLSNKYTVYLNGSRPGDIDRSFLFFVTSLPVEAVKPYPNVKRWAFESISVVTETQKPLKGHETGTSSYGGDVDDASESQAESMNTEDRVEQEKVMKAKRRRQLERWRQKELLSEKKSKGGLVLNYLMGYGAQASCFRQEDGDSSSREVQVRDICSDLSFWI